jgi:hypothetical protein
MFEDGIPTVQPDESKRMKAFDIVELLQVTVLPSGNGAAAKVVPTEEPEAAGPVEASPDVSEM